MGSTETGSQSPTPKTITFTIDGKEYSCEEGTTWHEWIQSTANEIDCWCSHCLRGHTLDSDDMAGYIFSADTLSSVYFSWGEGVNSIYNR